MNNILNYKDAVSYITSIPRFVNGNEYEELRNFYEYAYGSNRHNTGAKVFHVAGTNGKGSVCAYMASILKSMGKKTGVFTSPHLVDMRERIAIDGVMISEVEFYEAFLRVKERLGDYIQTTGNKCSPTYFSWTYLIAVEVFDSHLLDAIIWETGLGGRYDATNVSDRKDVCIITEIGLDHMEYLGDTREKIALEKAGIMRKGAPVIIPDRCDSVTEVLREAANRTDTRIIEVPGLFKTNYEVTSKGIDFSYNSRYYNNTNFKLGTLAVYQVENASLAIAAIEQVFGEDEVSTKLIQEGITNMYWPGRMEVIGPGVIFDGAHNVDGIEAFISSVRLDGCKGRRYLLFSAVTDKQADLMLQMINKSRLFAGIGVAHISNSRGISNQELEHLTKGMSNCTVYSDVRNAYDSLLYYKKEDDYLYVCGSLYLIGELKEWS